MLMLNIRSCPLSEVRLSHFMAFVSISSLFFLFLDVLMNTNLNGFYVPQTNERQYPIIITILSSIAGSLIMTSEENTWSSRFTSKIYLKISEIKNWIIPAVSAIVWIAMLGTYFAVWSFYSFEIMPWMDHQKIMYISDLTANYLPGFFSRCIICQGLFFLWATILELKYSHINTDFKKSPLISTFFNSTLFSLSENIAVSAAVIAQSSAVVLSIYDTRRYSSLHLYTLITLCVSMGFLTFFQTLKMLTCENYNVPIVIIRSSYFVIEIALAVSMAFTAQTHRDLSAVTEWSLALIYPVWMITVSVILANVEQRTTNRSLVDETELIDVVELDVTISESTEEECSCRKLFQRR